MTADTLKILGIIVGGAGTIVSAVAKVMDDRVKSRATAPRTIDGLDKPDPPPTSRRRSQNISVASICIAVLGFVVAFGSEMASQREALDAAKRQATKTQQTLEGLARVLTRFETISMQFRASLPLDAAPLADYRHGLEKTLTALGEEGAEAGDSLDGVLVLSSSVSSGPGVFRLTFEHAPGPISRGGTGSVYLRSSAPYVALFRVPIDPRRFDSNFEGRPGTPIPDLRLVPAPGIGTMTLVMHDLEGNGSKVLTRGTLEYKGIAMPRSDWLPSGKISSVKDLEGAQAIFYCPWYVTTYPALKQLWDSTRVMSLTLIINDQHIRIDVAKLRPTETPDGMIYSYVFPPLIDF